MANGPDRSLYEREDFNRPSDRESFFDREDFELRERDMIDEIRRDLEDQERDRMEDQRRMSAAAEQRLLEQMRKLTAQDVRDIVNNANMKVTPSGVITRRSQPSGRDVIRRSGQFTMQGFDLPTKKPRKKNKKHCKNLSQCLRQANAELRTKRGAIRKGKTQADIMRRAQKLLRKM